MSEIVILLPIIKIIYTSAAVICLYRTCHHFTTKTFALYRKKNSYISALYDAVDEFYIRVM